MMSPTSHHLPKARIMYKHHLRTSVAHPPVWLEGHPTALHPEPCRSQTSNRISLPTRRWPLQRFHNDQKPKCRTYHWSSTPNAGPAHDLQTPPVSGPAGETATLTILTSLMVSKRICSKRSPRQLNFGHPPFDPVSLSAAARLVAPCEAVRGSPCPTSCNLSHGFFNVLDYREAAHLHITGSTTHTNIVERNV